MSTLQIDRRAIPRDDAVNMDSRGARIIGQGILLRSCVGTVGAVEFLKAHGVEGVVISRVLSGGPVRMGDPVLSARQELLVLEG